MATTIEFSAEYPVKAKDFIDFMSDPELHEYLAQMSGVKHRKMKNRRIEGNKRYWEVDIAVSEKLPSFAKSLISEDRLQWCQKFEMDIDLLQFKFHVEHGLPTNWLIARGTGQVKEKGEGSILMFNIYVESSIPLLSKKIESTISERVREMLEADAKMRRDFIVQKIASQG